MSKNSIKVLAAIVIWAAAGYFAYSYYKRLFPDLPNRSGRGMAGRTWEHPDKEIAAFMKADPPSKLVVKVKRSKPGSERTNFQTMDRDRTQITIVKGSSVREAFASLRGLPSWKVTQLPMDRNRWDVFARTAKPEESAGRTRTNFGEQREEVGKRFLDYLKWEVKPGERPATLYNFRKRTEADGPAPQLSEFAGRPTRFSSGRWKPPLGQATGMVSGGGGDEPVVMTVDKDVRQNQPNLKPDEQLRIPNLGSSEQAARYLCALYGVAFDVSQTKADAYLVYHPKYAKPEEIRAWEEGKPVTADEKARAEQSSTSAADSPAETTATATAP